MADFDEVLDLRAYLREQESSAAGLGLTEAVVEAVEHRPEPRPRRAMRN